MKHKAPQLGLDLGTEPFKLVAEETTDGDRIAREAAQRELAAKNQSKKQADLFNNEITNK